MKNLDRLLEALARQLPRSADRASIVAALREAAKALPESQAKTRIQLGRREQDCVAKVEAWLKEKDVEEGVDVASDVVVSDVVHAKDDPAVAAFADIDENDTASCVARCGALLREALVGLRPAKLAEEALEGLMAILPPSKLALDHEMLEHYMRLLPAAAAALSCSESQVWGRFLGSLLAALAHPTQHEIKGSASKLGVLIALNAQHVSARAALRHGLGKLEEAPDAGVLACLASAVLPIVHVGFGQLNPLKGVTVVRSDLAALLHTLRFIGLCRKASVGETCALNEACESLRIALEQHFEASTLYAELQSMGNVSPKRRKLSHGGPAGKGKAMHAKLVCAAVTKAGPGVVKRLVSASGLPGSAEDDGDRRATAARARGEMFFEDVSGAQKLEEVIAASSLGRLDGVEAVA